MEIPDLVRERLGDEEIRASVSLGDEDAVCLTPTRTLVYRGEGLLSDESVSVLPHDVERIDVSEGRRKTKYVLTYVDGEESFTTPGSRAEKVLERLLEGVLRVNGVVAPEESVVGVYRFSELTLILTDGRLVKHIGASVWDEDFEEFAFADVTGLAFEEGSVATQIVLSIDERPQRIKAPNDDAPKLRQTLTDALCDFHGVDSLPALNELVGVDADEDDGTEERASGASGGLTLDEGIDPLVGGEPDDDGDGGDPMESPRTAGSASGTDDGATDAAPQNLQDDPEVADPEPAPSGTDAGLSSDDPAAETGETAAVPTGDGSAISRTDVDAIGEQLDTLTTAVKRQNELLRKQQRTIKQLVEELRQGR